MFGRDKTSAPSTPPGTSPPAGSAPVKEGGKGRPTPTRKAAEARNRRPVVGGTSTKPAAGATRQERKAHRAAQAEAARRQRLVARQGLASGDERYLPARDKGPARRFVRDYVDARRNLGELILPVVLVSFLVNFIAMPWLRIAGLVAVYGLALLVAVDAFRLSRRIKGLVTVRFGEAAAAGTGVYAIVRSMQIRRLRTPPVMVGRGEFPS